MRKILLLAIIVFTGLTLTAQDFSNKGKDFWITSGWHYGMGTNNPPVMTLSLTSDVNTTYSIEAYGVGVITSGNITANLVTVVNIPSTYFTYVPATGGGNGLFTGKAIHVTAAKPIVIYSFTTQSLSSAATLCLPTNVLGKQYYAASYTQLSANPTGNNFITIIAVEDNTSIEIIPTQSTVGGWVPNSVNIVNLNKGEIYQVLGTMTGNSGSDLTGTSIRSIASGSGGCKKIAVFSGSGRLWLGAGCTNGADNLYQQLYPASTWGRKYLTVPSSGRLTNYYRIITPKPSPTANIRLNGVVIPASSFVNNFYEFSNNTPNLIEADSSICVAQYFTSAGCVAGNANPYDPDMVILNPVEQNISDVTLISSDRLNHTPTTPQHYIHVIMRNGGTGISSFRFDGGPIPPASFWVTHPRDPNYSYLYLNNVSETYHSLKSDSGFNAIAYGYANFETYAYSAGTNVKDFYQQIGVSTQYGIETTPSVCTNSPFKFKVSLPYCVDSIRWDLTNLPGPPVPPIDTVRYSRCVPGAGGPDSTTSVNGVTLYWYSLPSVYSFSTVGTYPVTITTYYAPNSTGCGSEQQIDFDLTVSDPPAPNFVWTPGICMAEPYQFNETTPQSPKPTYKWYWNFGDPGSGANNISNLRNPTHIFSTPGPHTVTYSAITTPGCLVDTVRYVIDVPGLPSAIIDGTNTVCINGAPQNIIFSGSGTGPYTFYYHITPGGGPFNVTSVGSTATIAHNPATAGTFIYTLDSVRITGSTLCVSPQITGQQATITVNPNHAISLTSANAVQTRCINNAITDITYNLSGGATGATVTGLPAGVTFSVTGSVLTITGIPNPVFAGSSATYPFTIQTTGNACLFANASGSITVNADHTLSLSSASPDRTACINTAIPAISYTIGGGATGVNITGLPTGVTYTVTGTTVTIQGSPSTTVGSPFMYTVSTTGNSCVVAPQLTGTIIVNPDHAISLTSANAVQTRCINNAITDITYNLSGGATGATVTGLPAGLTFSVTGTVLTITGTPNPVFAGGSATYPFTIQTTGNACLFANASGSITVNADHSLSLSSASPDRTACINTTIPVINYTIGGGATGVNITGLPTGVTYTVTGTTVTIQGSPSTTVGSPFMYTVSTTGNSCVVAPQLTGTIIVNPDHAISLTSANAVQTRCINNAITDITYNLSGGATGATVTGLPAGVTFSVTGSVLTITGTPNPVFAGSSATYPFTIQTTGNTCSVGNDAGSITVNADHTLSLSSASPDREVCINTAIPAISYTIGGGATGVNITGLPTGVTYTVTGTTVTIQGLPNTTVGSPFTYTVATTGNSCMVAPQLTGIITANPIPTASFSGTTEACQNDPVLPGITFTGADGTRPYTFTYTIDPGTGPGLPQTVSTTALSNSVTVQQPTGVVGTFTYKLTSVQDGTVTACSQSVSVPDQIIKINPVPTASVDGSKLVCINSTSPDITFTGAGGTAPYNFAYRVDAGAGPGPLQFISTTGTNTSVTLQVPTTVAGTFTYILESVQDGSSTACLQAQTGNAVIDVSDVFPVADFSFGGPVCIPNALVKFQNMSAISNGTPLTYLWDFDDGSNTSTAVNPSHLYGTANTFNVILEATSNAGCKTTNTIPVNNIHPQPKADFTFNKPGICIGDNVTITDNSDGKDGTINQWNWDLGDRSTRTVNSFTYTYTDTIPYSVVLYSVNSFGCNSDTLTKIFNVYPYPHVNAGPDRFILEGGTITLESVTFANDAQYLWTPNLYLLDDKVAKARVHKPLTDMTYRLTITARGGCTLSDDVFVKLLKFPIIPNTFTPNNDHINDEWRIDYLNTYPDNRVQIFTRSGQLVFESRGYNTPWDGTLKGKPLPFDTYYYIIEPGNGRDPITGYVTIIK